MANFSGTVTGKSTAYTDGVNALNTNVNLTDRQNIQIRQALIDGARAIDGFSVNAGLTMTGTWTILTGANPSMSVSVTT